MKSNYKDYPVYDVNIYHTIKKFNEDYVKIVGDSIHNYPEDEYIQEKGGNFSIMVTNKRRFVGRTFGVYWLDHKISQVYYIMKWTTSTFFALNGKYIGNNPIKIIYDEKNNTGKISLYSVSSEDIIYNNL